MPADRLVRRVVLALDQPTGPLYQPSSLLMHAPLSPKSCEPPKMGTRWPIPLLPTGKPLKGVTLQYYYSARCSASRPRGGCHRLFCYKVSASPVYCICCFCNHCLNCWNILAKDLKEKQCLESSLLYWGAKSG